MEDFVLPLIEHLKYFGIFLGSFVEGPATALAAGFLVKSKLLNFTLAFVVHAVGDFSADMAYFFAGRNGSKRILRWIGRLFRLSEDELFVLKKKVEHHHLKVIFVGKLTHFLGLPNIIALGLSDYSWKKFFVFNFVATLIKSFLLILIGYSVGALWQQQQSYISQVGIVAALVAIVAVFYFYIKRRFAKKA